MPQPIPKIELDVICLVDVGFCQEHPLMMLMVS